MPLYLCKTCMIPKERDAVHFYRDKGQKDGLDSLCIPCRKVVKADYRARHAERLASETAERRAAWSPEKLAEERAKNTARGVPRYHLDIEASRLKERARIRTAEDRAYRRWWNSVNTDRTRASGQRRRGRLRASTDHFTRDDMTRLCATQMGLCHYCKRQMTDRGRLQMTVDHLIPLSRGGDNSPVNIALACRQCNLKKGSQTDDEFFARTDRPGINDI